MVTGVVGQMMTAMKGMGNGDLDHAGLVKFVEELAKIELLEYRDPLRDSRDNGNQVLCAWLDPA